MRNLWRPYGVGFNPAVKPKSARKKTKYPPASKTHQETKTASKESDDQEEPGDVAVLIQPSELVPSVCYTKASIEAAFEKLKLRKHSSKLATSEQKKNYFHRHSDRTRIMHISTRA